MSAQEKANQYLKTASLYQLGELQTESLHPKTMDLSEQVQKETGEAIQALVEVDELALEKFKTYLPFVEELREAVQSTLAKGNKVYLCGCGATGRLSLTIECLWRQANPGSEQLQAFMAGGDVALVHSIEGFEDYPEYGARQLRELGFKDGDLLLGPTEGGETPYVIGAIEEAARLSQNSPWMLYCNPDEVLSRTVDRSKRVIENPQIKKLNLSVGPMALSGSTRMQASTVLQLACGLACFDIDKSDWLSCIDQSIDLLKKEAVGFLNPFIKAEAEIYEQGDYILYSTINSMITVFTDTTERAPTFSLMPFRNPKSPLLKDQPASLSYVISPQSETHAQAWTQLFRRPPRALNWKDGSGQVIDERVNEDYLQAFDFSKKGRSFRENLLSPKSQVDFEIHYENNCLHWKLKDLHQQIEVPPNWSELFKQTFLKMLLNTHSTLVMGLMGRYKNNVMTWVYPTNGKLIDRTARYVGALLKSEGLEVSYEKIILEIFTQLERNEVGQSIVLYCVEAFKKRN